MVKRIAFFTAITMLFICVLNGCALFDKGEGKAFEEGKLGLEDLVAYAKQHGEPEQISGKQELYEAILNMYC